MIDTQAISRLLEMAKAKAESSDQPDILNYLVFVTPFSSACPSILESLTSDMYVSIIGDYISWHVKCFV